MALKLSVKIGDVTNLSDARYAAGMGVDYIGFNINTTSKNFVTPKTFKEITNWISGIGVIGEIGNNVPENVEEYPLFLTETTNLDSENNYDEVVLRIDVKQLSASEISASISTLKTPLFWVLETSANQIETHLDFFKGLCNANPIYISTKFSEALLEKIVNEIKPKGIEIKGSLEDKPGFKDYDGIADVLEWLEED